MIPLGENNKRYLPSLADGYRFLFEPLRGNSISCLILDKSGTCSVSENLRLPSDATSEVIREIVLDWAYRAAHANGLWNPEYVAKMREALSDLEPPKDEPKSHKTIEDVRLTVIDGKYFLQNKSGFVTPAGLENLQ